jgi:hypothetical protein
VYLELQIAVREAQDRVGLFEASLLADLRQDWSWSETAARHGIKPGTRDRVKKRLARKLRLSFRPPRAPRATP